MTRLSRRPSAHVRLIARIVAGVLFTAGAITGLAGVAGAAGNNGTVKLGSSGQAFTNSNDPHLTCPIQIQWTGFDQGLQTYDVTFTGINPTGGTVTPASDHGTFPDGSVTNTRTYSLVFNGATPNNKGEYHVGIDINTTHAANSDFKQKTIWVQGCAGGSVAVTGQCNAAGNGYNWSVAATPTQPGGGAAVDGTWTKQGAASPTGTFNTNAAGTGSFTTGAGVNALDITGSTAGWTFPATATAAACAQPRNLQLAAACTQPLNNTITWTVTDPAANPQVTGLSSSNGALAGSPSLAPGAHTTFTSSAPANTPVTVNGTVNGQPVSSNSVSLQNACAPGQAETPATVVLTDTCTDIHAVFTSADQHTTHFDVTEPDGSNSTVVGTDTKDYAADAANPDLSVTFDGNPAVNHTWAEPAGCSPGQADPEVSADKACKTGISVVLSNMNGTADVTFTVTDPEGDVHQLPVRAGQLRKESYAVEEDSTGVVTVTAPGLAKKTVTYEKDCSTVLGVKETRPPKTVVEGEKQTKTPEELPFTGDDTKREMQTAAGLLLLGSLLCGLASIRRRPTA
jgi:hypothetical protein